LSAKPNDADNTTGTSESSPQAAQLEYWRGLAQLAREEDLDEIEVEKAGVRVVLRARSSEAPALQAMPLQAMPVAAPGVLSAAAPQPAAAPPQAGASAAPAKDDNLIEIVSPMVGVFYRAPSPSDPNFIEVGDHVEIGQTLALVEAMKVFNEITAEVAGTVKEIKVNSSDLVETGQVLVTIRP
jgi:acetyl-CoA carboxylase biotin carboxyl carrier protein